MKKYIIMGAILLAALLLLPPAFMKIFGSAFPAKSVEELSVTLGETGEVITVTAEEYVTGCLFAQIDVTYGQEALKAQAVAAYTYALRLLDGGNQLSDSTALCQPFFTPEKAREYYGDSYDKYLPKVQEAAAYGASHALCYENKPIYSVYHSVSAGVTARPEYIWGISLPYLAQVDCPADRTYLHFETKNEISPEDMRIKLLAHDGTLEMPLDYSLWFDRVEKDENGYVISARVGDKKLSGGDLWRLLGLRSTCFDISWNGMAFTVTAQGYGHCAGMSQYTANVMAGNGCTAEEILAYFYPGAVLKTV
ncbi:MAG: SpoIID/LytB domain-containing protein [Oscillospiraceae bacterium]|nr:SpoIID/LytB domain-containing protein [Oscillospiraceae bacterium]